ncbi:hypothetical protein [Lichenicoccus sp.]|uniref:hypothetical protein n=1 Tax=Lichenicoccus sp. TaxID=2781899 RepID=UPI003D12C2C4
MIRTIADVALCNYDLWYILAHSQGSVIAFNGLMENASSWPGYLDERRWQRLPSRGMAGAADQRAILAAAKTRVPACPVWAQDNEIAYRRRIFENFRGLLTYGCPWRSSLRSGQARSLSAVSPPSVREPGGWMCSIPSTPSPGSWKVGPLAILPPVRRRTISGYTSSRLLLRSHIRYMAQDRSPLGNSTLADGVARWLLHDSPAALTASSGTAFFKAGGPRHRWRWWLAALQWLVASVLATLAASAFTIVVWSPISRRIIRKLVRMAGLAPWPSKPLVAAPIKQLVLPTCARLFAGVLAVTLLVGTAVRLFGEEKRQRGRLPDENFSGVQHAPDPWALHAGAMDMTVSPCRQARQA